MHSASSLPLRSVVIVKVKRNCRTRDHVCKLQGLQSCQSGKAQTVKASKFAFILQQS